MNTVKDIRYQNFLKLIDEVGSAAKLARLCGYTQPTYFYQLRAKRPNKNGQDMQIGSRVARKLEEATNKPKGWLDKEHHENNKNNMTFTAFRQPENQSIQTITLGITGASGFPYALRLLEVLLSLGKTVYLVYSDAAQMVSQKEADFVLPNSAREAQEALCARFQVSPQQLWVFEQKDWNAPIASGTAVADAMVICPASMGSTAAIAHGFSENLLQRAADVSIKERRPLIIVPRETPLSAIHLENLLKLSQLGCTILPPCAGFYQRPQQLNDIIDFVVARILDQLRLPHQLIPQWGENCPALTQTTHS